MSRTSPAALELQRIVVEQRSRGRPAQNLSSHFQALPCEEELRKIQRSAGFHAPSHPCGRAVWPDFASAEEVAILRSFAEEALARLHHRGAEVSMALSGCDTPWLLQRAQQVLTRAFHQPMELRGALLRRVALPALLGERQMMPSHDTFAAHADMATVAAYHFSALLYLNGAPDFRHGEFVFMDGDHDRMVTPSAGQLLGFSSGLENLHRVVPPEDGARYVLAMWFGAEAFPKLPCEGAPEPPGGTAG